MEQDAPWEALSAWASFESVPGNQKVHEETLFFQEAFTHVMEQTCDHIHDLKHGISNHSITGNN
jgi:hypothetical protein